MTFLIIMDILGTVAFAISGAIIAAEKKMDMLGINMLAIVTATGGGMLRDIIIGRTPPVMFTKPMYVGIAFLTANICFYLMRRHLKMSKAIVHSYHNILFWFDTLGLAAFTVDGCLAGIHAGHGDNIFLVVFLGFMTGVGGGLLRDMLAARTPALLNKHIYGLASIAGGLIVALTAHYFPAGQFYGNAVGFGLVIVIRYLAMHYEWDLPTAA